MKASCIVAVIYLAGFVVFAEPALCAIFVRNFLPIAGRQLLIQRQLPQSPTAFRRMSALTEIMRASVKPGASYSTVVGASISA